MKYITEQKLSELMNYSNVHSFRNSKTNYRLLINLVNHLENTIDIIKDEQLNNIITNKDRELNQLKDNILKIIEK